MAYVADGEVVDGSWELNILVTDLQVEKTLRVMGDLHIGGVMVKLVQALDIALDWSDHALWWPEKNKWLHRARSTLDQYNVQADAKLQFTPMHKNLKVQLPDLQVLELSVDFSIKCFATVVQTCKELGIRHPEELSFLRKWDKDDLKRVAKEVHKRKKRGDPDQNGPLSANGTHHNSSGSLDGGKLSPYPSRSPVGPSPTVSTLTQCLVDVFVFFFSSSVVKLFFPPLLLLSFFSSSSVVKLFFLSSSVVKLFSLLFCFEDLEECWARSLRQNSTMSQLLSLVYEIVPHINSSHILYLIRLGSGLGVSSWGLCVDEIDCTEEEMVVFAALQYQARIQSGLPQPEYDLSQNAHNKSEDDEIDAALKDLQESLEGSAISAHGDITHIPELCDYVKFFKPKKLTLKSYKRYYATFKDTFIAFYRSKEESQGPPVMAKIDVRGCEAQPDVNLSANKYGIKLFVPEPEGMAEICLRFDVEEQYCRWMAACKLASKGKTMADSSYEAEVQAIQSFLGLQHPVVSPTLNSSTTSNSTPSEINPEDYIAARFFKKIKTKSLVTKIMEAHASVQEMTLLEAKLAYIKSWQSLPEYGITYFRIKMANSRKEELMGVASNRIIRMDLNTGDSLKTWRYNTLQSWHVNWEVENVILDFDTEKVTFASMECSCKTIHEFIGGYIFLSMRSTDKNQSLNEEMFHKLTGGWHE
ncbi:unnamed protein product [Lymnaea stagnalis]|uniref:PH domain-containing protein n=1 Tax=Lymnaea stagnalis TaxID=6523 RepID=A0AAV2HWQ2_LYMST